MSNSWSWANVWWTTADYQKPPNPFNNKNLGWIALIAAIIFVLISILR